MKKLFNASLVACILLCYPGFNAVHSKGTTPFTDHRDQRTAASIFKTKGNAIRWAGAAPTLAICPTEFTVNSLGDEPDANPGDNVCATAGGDCTLRAAIQEANALGSCASAIDVNFSVTGTIQLSSVLPTLSQSLNLNGPGANQLTVRRNIGGNYRIFTIIAPGKTFLLQGITMTNGRQTGTGIGGGIYIEGVGIHVTIQNSVISDNQADNFGAGLRIASGTTVNITGSNISGNIASGATSGSSGTGAGIDNGGNLTIINSTFSGNRANSGNNNGGAIWSNGTLSLRNCTITNNSAAGANSAGGIYKNGGAITLISTIVAGNTNAGAPDLRSNSGVFISSGYNLIGNNSSVSATFPDGAPNANNDYVGTNATPLNPALLALGDNGGPTPTHALLACSPAVNAGTNSGAPAADQRGLVRPYNSGISDIGAFELQSNAVTSITYYQDMDGDGFGNAAVTQMTCAQPTGYVTDNTDCNDNDDAINPGETEICDGIDNNCDGSNDEGLPTTRYYYDFDGDGYGEAVAFIDACVPSGFYTATLDGDCIADDADINPGATEICDGIDNNCNGTTDEGLITRYYYDLDGDGYGEVFAFIDACVPSGFYTALVDGDCAADDADIYPGATEICDGKDNNCDGVTDEGFVTRYFYDNDGDGYGQNLVFVDACAPDGFYTATVEGDCNDDDVNINPGATEVCNDIDDDCDGITDDGFPISRYYYDGDDDGFGDSSAFRDICGPIGFYNTTIGGDCNGGDNTIYPNAPELCDGIDNNCDGQTDEGLTFITYYPDADGDGYGTDQGQSLCANPGAGFSTQAGDCNDNNDSINPGESELCDSIDNNCDGQTDEGLTLITYYTDADGDGYGTGTGQSLCANPGAGFATQAGDCNDNDDAINPGESELCDGIDNNCDGITDEGLKTEFYADLDGDGFGDPNNVVIECTQPQGFVNNTDDCDDTDDRVNPTEEEVCDSKDNDCNGLIDDIGGAFTGTWNNGNVGTANGSASFPPCNAEPDDTFVINATGFSTSSSDKLHAVYQTLCGNGEIIARVVSVTGGGWAGIMLRATLDPGSKKVSLKTQLSTNVRREIRTVTNGAASGLNFSRPQHTWLRLVRNGSNFVGYTSTNGSTWSFAFSATVSMTGCIYAGLFAESINANVTTTATFDNVSILSATQNLGIAGVQPTADSDGQMPQLSAAVFPNPTDGRVTVSFTNIPENRVTIRVFNALGERVKMQQTEVLEKATLQLDLEDLADGVYTLRIETQGQQVAVTKRIVLAKSNNIRP